MCPSLLTFRGNRSYNSVNYLIYGKFLVKKGINNMSRIRNRILIMLVLISFFLQMSSLGFSCRYEKNIQGWLKQLMTDRYKGVRSRTSFFPVSMPYEYKNTLFAIISKAVKIIQNERKVMPAWIKTKQPIDLSLIHISEPTRLLSISYAVFCLKKKKKTTKKKTKR